MYYTILRTSSANPETILPAGVLQNAGGSGTTTACDRKWGEDIEGKEEVREGKRALVI